MPQSNSELVKEVNTRRLMCMVPRSTYDRALVRICENPRNEGLRDTVDPVVVYSRSLIVQALMEVDGMTADDACEWLSYNVEGAYLGPLTPLYDGKEFDDDQP